MSQTGHINHWAVEKVGGVIALIFSALFTCTSSMLLLRSVSVLCSFFSRPSLSRAPSQDNGLGAARSTASGRWSSPLFQQPYSQYQHPALALLIRSDLQQHSRNPSTVVFSPSESPSHDPRHARIPRLPPGRHRHRGPPRLQRSPGAGRLLSPQHPKHLQPCGHDFDAAATADSGRLWASDDEYELFYWLEL